MATIYATDFDSLSPGDINGQDGWSVGEASPVVTTTKAHSGAQSVTYSGGNSEPIHRIISISERSVNVTWWHWSPDAFLGDIVPPSLELGDSSEFLFNGLFISHGPAGFTISMGGNPGDDYFVTLPFGDWVQMTAKIRFSTVSSGDANLDGRLQIFVNGTSVLDLDHIKVYATTSGFGAGNNTVDRIAFHLQNTWLDDVTVTDEDIPDVPPPNDSAPCCGSGGDPRPDPGNPSGPNPGDVPTPLQPWTPQCSGGGMVPSAMDVVDQEVWVL